MKKLLSLVLLIGVFYFNSNVYATTVKQIANSNILYTCKYDVNFGAGEFGSLENNNTSFEISVTKNNNLEINNTDFNNLVNSKLFISLVNWDEINYSKFIKESENNDIMCPTLRLHYDGVQYFSIIFYTSEIQNLQNVKVVSGVVTHSQVEVENEEIICTRTSQIRNMNSTYNVEFVFGKRGNKYIWKIRDERTFNSDVGTGWQNYDVSISDTIGNIYTINSNDVKNYFGSKSSCENSTLFLNITSNNNQAPFYMTIQTEKPDDSNNGAYNPSDAGEDDGKHDEISSFSCKYIGKINGKTLFISKNDGNWTINYPDGTTKNGEAIGITENCEDVFYSASNKSINMINADSKYADLYIKNFCNKYDDLEQFCNNGTCKIKDAACGNSTDTYYGECPEELRPILTFIKRVVFNTLQIFVPIILIIMGTIDMARAVMSNDDKGMKEATSRFIRRALSAVLVFFITTIVIVVMDMFAKVPEVGKQEDWKACWLDID